MPPITITHKRNDNLQFKASIRAKKNRLERWVSKSQNIDVIPI